MAVTEEQFAAANRRADEVASRAGRVIRATFDAQSRMVVVELSSGVEVRIPSKLTEGLRGASADQLSEIEVTPSGLGLHWPQLDADLYVPAALMGFLGSERWMGELGKIMGSRGGRVRSAAKAAAARENGAKGGRPPKVMRKEPIVGAGPKSAVKKKDMKAATRKQSPAKKRA